ncbi:MAG TPA: tetratricopeptide repeat protein, partial [Casimicrobiaceae bacterium]|nr:tetratricopeptide repeat protein [Casimicrobiaceae bacterium]
MTFERYAGWLARGRSHQAEGRAIDALLCYRRALREAASGIDARFHLGEVAWSLGNYAEAIAAWQHASELSPQHVPSLHALADAFAATGQIDAALQAARRVLAVQPDEPRAKALACLAGMANGESASDDRLASALQSSTNAPLPLLAAVALRALEHPAAFRRAVEVALDAAAVAPITRANADTLRLLALAAAKARLLERAQAFADRYAEACYALDQPAMPTLWPLRTAGAQVRACIVCAQGQLAELATIVDAIAARATVALRWTVFAAPDGTMEATLSSASAGLDVRPLPADVASASRGMAAFDFDVLVDVAGLHLPTGPLLVHRPARAMWSLQLENVPVARRLFDRIFTDDQACAIPAFGDAIAALAKAVAGESSAELGATELSKLWEGAVRAHEQGDVAHASDGYARVLRAQPGFAPAFYLAGQLARSAGDHATALEQMRAAVHAAPAFVDAREALADLEVDAGNPAAAMAIAREGLERSPDGLRLWRAVGRAALKAGDTGAAAAAFVEALKRDPTHGETHYNHGVALQMAGEPAEAARAYQRALAFDPALHAADFNLGVIFDQQGNAGAAIAAFSHVLERAPAHAAAYKALAETLITSGRIDAWFANFERFEAHCPQHLSLAALGLEVCAYRADFKKLDAYLDGLRSGRFSQGDSIEVLDALQQILYLLHFFDVEPQLIARHARTHDALARTIYGEPWQRRVPRTPGRVRIGYLSGDFRNHVMGKMMWEALRHHDRERFDIVGYATTTARDEWTERYASHIPLHSVDGIGDTGAAARIAEADLDVLVDLSTHT